MVSIETLLLLAGFVAGGLAAWLYLRAPRQVERAAHEERLQAREADILIQFLMEAILLAVAGGLVGTAFGYGAIVALARGLDWSMSLDPASLALALGVSSAIGIVFGFLPARRAAQLDPITALRNE